MPRPRMRKETVIMTVSIERELALALKKLARERGVSTSQLVERLIIEALGSRALEQAKPQIPSDPLSPSEGQQDPLLQLEVEEFESKLSRMERRAGELEQVVNAVAKGHYVRTGFEPHREQLLNRAFKLIKDWHEQRRWLYRLRRDLPRERASEFSRRMAELKKRLNALLELLGYAERG